MNPIWYLKAVCYQFFPVVLSDDELRLFEFCERNLPILQQNSSVNKILELRGESL